MLILAVTAGQIIPLLVIAIYLAVVLYIGIFAFRKGRETGEDFFLASRSVGSIIFFLALFATNMTAVAVLGSSGIAYKRGVGVFGLMASISGFVIPVTLFVIGTRLWALGKRFGHMTQVAFFRDRWDCSGIGTFLFALTAAMLLPYLIVSIVGGGTIVEALTGGLVNYHLAGAIVALVVMGNVFFGGMRGAVLVNVFQTLLFLSFGTIAFITINHNMGGFHHTVQNMLSTPGRGWPLQRLPSDPAMKQMMLSPVTTLEFFSYCFIPLSSIMFPHMSIMCLTAKKVTAFKKTIILYPLCIMAIWLPSVYLGSIANGEPRVNAAIAGDSPDVKGMLASHGQGKNPDTGKPWGGLLMTNLGKADTPPARQLLADIHNPSVTISSEDFGERLVKVVGPLKAANPPAYTDLVREVGRLSKQAPTDSVLLQMLRLFVPAWLGGLLAAGIISAVMGSDCHQILALSTMFTKDVFDYYGGRKRYGEKGTVFMGRAFIIIANSIAFAIAWWRPPIFELAVSWAFSGFAALAPVMLAGLFWKRSTKWGAFAAGLFVAVSLIVVGIIEHHFALPKGTPPAEKVIASLTILGQKALTLSPGSGRLFIFGLMPVVWMVVGSAACVIVFSLLTYPPSQETLRRYFAAGSEDATSAPTPGARPTIAA
jgi:Na+/proline symporter